MKMSRNKAIKILMCNIFIVEWTIPITSLNLKLMCELWKKTKSLVYQWHCFIPEHFQCCIHIKMIITVYIIHFCKLLNSVLEWNKDSLVHFKHETHISSPLTCVHYVQIHAILRNEHQNLHISEGKTKSVNNICYTHTDWERASLSLQLNFCC